MTPSSPTDPPVRLVVLFGGQSAEHDVSRVTAVHVLRAVDRSRYDVVPIGITRDGRWLDAGAALAALDEPAALTTGLDVAGAAVDPVPAVASASGQQVVVFPLLHGPFGEDGTVQGMLELAGVPYVGAGVLGSALAMDKAKAKEVIEHAGIPQCRWLTLRDTDVDDTTPAAIEDALGLPVFVKPANLGSSVGVSKAHDLEELRDALALAAGYDEWIVVEEHVEGREIEVAVLGNTELRVSVPGEIRPGAEFYDYADKYLDGAAELVIPAELPDDVAAELADLARRSFAALRAEGMARVDFFYEEDGRGLLLNEINTIPGFTPISMYPKLWEASGLPYAQLIDELVALAIERHARRTAHRRTDH
ncbi:D-alanine--D-alanine ligase family protein [Actinomarinicola tropica]|uniref:D-alanine--D-alanine ligase n=1 Tax=Actinomarinicola tropica TaxID=2789776 RepID=A0A5Q2RE05_9ACTN|nr:D-alanine--D-alanine ligase family protein [Actinomarinicola tropica]QGG95109.1 D-alanine--D-alanine ligase [Actinomarinicola tropica]